jgi:flagellar motor switch protein FliN/FliY
VNIETVLPYHWLRTCSEEIVKLDAIPLLGNPPTFPWALFSNALGQALAIQNLQITPQEIAWREKDRLLEGMGTNPQVVEFQVSPLKGSAVWVLPEEALKEIFTMTVGTEEALFPEQEIEWEKEFYHFAAFEAVQAFQKSGFDPSLLPQIQEEAVLPEDPACLCLEVEISAGEKKLHGRLIIPPALRESFQSKFASDPLKMPDSVLSAALITVQVVGGSMSLPRSTWNNLKLGDFLILDSCSLSTEEDKGRAQLFVNGKPIFRAKVKDGQIKILEHPLLYEVSTPMAKDEEFDEEEELETDIDDEFTEEHEEETEEETGFTEDEEHSEAEAAVAAPKPAPLSKSAAPKPEEKSPLAHPEEIAMNVTIEAGRIQMTIKQLMELQPGNVLDLNIRPERGVDLTINGRCIGRGELLKVGDMLGVRILEKA